MQNAHPGLPEFEYVKPASLADASQFLEQHPGEARPFLGGTDTFVRMRDGFWKEKYLVDIKGLDGTNELSYDPACGLTIGAAVNMNRVIAFPQVKRFYPLIAEAASTVASYQLRNRATIVGNICNASPAGDTIGACLVYRANLRVHGTTGLYAVSLANFFHAPGKTSLKRGDVVVAVQIPPAPLNSVVKYIKLGRNSVGDLAIIGVTVMGYPDHTAMSGFRFKIVLASVAPVPLIPVKAEEILAGQKITEKTIDEAAMAAMDSATPIDDVRGGAKYRKLMVRNLTRKALLEVWEKIK
jgi:CO/xanthine dehydrogenase FAD-binding subunit